MLQCTIDELKVEMSTQKKKQEELDLQRCQDKESADAKIIDLQKKVMDLRINICFFFRLCIINLYPSMLFGAVALFKQDS